MGESRSVMGAHLLQGSMDLPFLNARASAEDMGLGVSEPTGVIGTKLYTAPEIEEGLPHNSKVAFLPRPASDWLQMRERDTGCGDFEIHA